MGGIILVILQILDADNGQRLESSTGKIATRDIVQFVPMREVHGEFMRILQYNGQNLGTLNKIFATIGAGTDYLNPTLAQSVLYVLLVFLHNIQNIDIHDIHKYMLVCLETIPLHRIGLCSHAGTHKCRARAHIHTHGHNAWIIHMNSMQW